MPVWNPERYLTFGDLRTQPSRDLAARVEVAGVRRVVDLGCGPGNSTAVCAARWPEATVVGLDSSAEMIEAARRAYPEGDWRVADIVDWVRNDDGERYDVIFSNAALQWVGDHGRVFPALMGRLNPGGALAVQMPSYEGSANRVMRGLAASGRWQRWFPEGRAKEWRSHDLEFYYEALAMRAGRVDLWSTEYVHIMRDRAAIVEWYKGTGLRPYLEAIGEDGERARFLAEFLEGLEPFYPLSRAGGVLFPFRRVFLVAYSR